MSFSSGSDGNCYLFEWADGAFLVDAGVSVNALKAGLQKHGLSTEKLLGVLITHDHADHIRSLGSFCKKLGLPVWMGRAMRGSHTTRWLGGTQLESVLRLLPESGPVEIVPGRALATPFSIPHDATETVGYAISIDGLKAVIITDIGQMVPEALAYASQASTVIIEANYDEGMLLHGGYPKVLQDRIRGGHGHLSNSECAEAVRSFLHPGLRNVFLCHLSAHNNTPEKALAEVGRALDGSGVRLEALPRTECSPMFEL